MMPIALDREQSGGGEYNQDNLCIESQIVKMRRDHVGLGSICCWYYRQGKWQLSIHSVAECIPQVVLDKSHVNTPYCISNNKYALTHMG